jgi:DNA-binding SARP family transcriptional activator
VRIQLLGGFEVRDPGGRRVTFPRHAAERLVAHLALHRLRSVPREQLAEALWPDAPAAASRNRFDVTLNAARRALEPEAGARGPFRILVGEAGVCRLAAEGVTVDVEEFERRARECEPLLARATRSPWGAAQAPPRAEAARSFAALERALEAWGGELLPGIRDAEWVETERARLAARHRRLALGLGGLALVLDRPERAVECATRVLAEDPLEEEALRLAMRALARRGEGARAQAVYREFSARLARELDATPSPETVALAGELAAPAKSAAAR